MAGLVVAGLTTWQYEGTTAKKKHEHRISYLTGGGLLMEGLEAWFSTSDPIVSLAGSAGDAEGGGGESRCPEMGLCSFGMAGFGSAAGAGEVGGRRAGRRKLPPKHSASSSLSSPVTLSVHRSPRTARVAGRRRPGVVFLRAVPARLHSVPAAPLAHDGFPARCAE